MLQNKKPIVLLIEADASLRRLIALGLHHRGLYVIEASSPACIPSFDAQQIDLLILDLDGNGSQNRTFLEQPLLSAVSIILLAWDYPPSISATQNVATTTRIKYLTKPFDARVLHETIDQLFLVRIAEEAAQEARAEELLLTTYSKQTAPSLWPIVTAAGLLLVFIGMMLQLAVMIVGILIVISALLLWMLDNRTRVETVALV